jgi:hypothetical protein
VLVGTNRRGQRRSREGFRRSQVSFPEIGVVSSFSMCTCQEKPAKPKRGEGPQPSPARQAFRPGAAHVVRRLGGLPFSTIPHRVTIEKPIVLASYPKVHISVWDIARCGCFPHLLSAFSTLPTLLASSSRQDVALPTAIAYEQVCSMSRSSRSSCTAVAGAPACMAVGSARSSSITRVARASHSAGVSDFERYG